MIGLILIGGNVLSRESWRAAESLGCGAGHEPGSTLSALKKVSEHPVPNPLMRGLAWVDVALRLCECLRAGRWAPGALR